MTRRRALEGGGERELRVDEEVALVLLGDEAARQPRGDEAREDRDDDEEDHGERGLADQVAARAYVAVGRPREPAIESPEEHPQRSPHLALRPQEQRRERRAQRERVEGRDEDGDGDGDRELLVHLPGDARDERRRHEDGGQDQGDRHHRARHLLHRLERSVARRQPLLDVALDRLDHHDGVVHHEADGQHQAEERQRVDREAQEREDHERADQRDRHRQQRDQGRPEALEEDEDDDGHQGEGLDERYHDLPDAGGHRQGRVERRHVVKIVRESRLGLLHQLRRRLHGLDGVGAGQLVDGDERPGAPVEAGFPEVGLLAQFDACHVSHPHEGPVGSRPDHDVLEVLHARQPPLRQHRVGELLAPGHGLATDLARRIHGVLGLKRAHDLIHRDVELGQGVGIDPEPDGVLVRPEDLHLTNPGDARHRVVEVDVGVVAEEELVVGALGRVQDEQPQRARHGLPDRDALVDDIWRQLGGGLRVPHVHEHLVDVRIGGDVEAHSEIHLAAAGLAGRVHVEHVVHAAHLLLDGRGHRLLERHRVGARVVRGQEHLGRGDVRVLRDGQLGHGDETDDHHEDGDDHRHDRPVDEELGHGALLLRRAVRGVSARLPALGHGRLDLRTGLDLVESLDDDPLARLQPLLDDPEGADSLAELNLSHVHRLVGADHGDLMDALEVLDGPLGNKERVLPEIDHGAHLHELAGAQELARVREHPSEVDGAGRPTRPRGRGSRPSRGGGTSSRRPG